MSLQLTNSNHTSASDASLIEPAELQRLEADLAELQRLKAAVGCPDGALIPQRAHLRLVADQIELRRLHALADAGLMGGTADRDGPPRLWTVAELAKQLALSPAAVRRRARGWSFTRCVAHGSCRGGQRGCDLRFIAKEAAAWVNSQRRLRAAQ